jgi:hypothetical protein
MTPTELAQKGLRVDSLRALYEAVKAGTATRTEVENLSCDIWQDERSIDAGSAYHGDMNAALALHNAVRPGWAWQVWSYLDGFFAVVDGPERSSPEVPGPNPARALLLADLAAMIQEGEW